MDQKDDFVFVLGFLKHHKQLIISVYTLLKDVSKEVKNVKQSPLKSIETRYTKQYSYVSNIIKSYQVTFLLIKKIIFDLLVNITS